MSLIFNPEGAQGLFGSHSLRLGSRPAIGPAGDTAGPNRAMRSLRPEMGVSGVNSLDCLASGGKRHAYPILSAVLSLRYIFIRMY